VTKLDFLSLRQSPKIIRGDIAFYPSGTRKILTLNELLVENAQGVELRLTGSYIPFLPSVTYNFIAGNCSICRLEINGNIHGDVGRNHKHEIKTDTCCSQKLPFPYRMDSLASKTAKEIWIALLRYGEHYTYRAVF
jgi:hypothetical protein